jgi:hypothetical protein
VDLGWVCRLTGLTQKNSSAKPAFEQAEKLFANSKSAPEERNIYRMRSWQIQNQLRRSEIFIEFSKTVRIAEQRHIYAVPPELAQFSNSFKQTFSPSSSGQDFRIDKRSREIKRSFDRLVVTEAGALMICLTSLAAVLGCEF